MIRLTHVILLVLLAAAARCQGVPPDFCVSFFDDCVLRFAGQAALATFPLAATVDNVAFTPAIVFPGEQIGIVNSNGVIPQFIESKPSGITATNVTAFGLTPTQFKPFTIVNTTTSGVGHETFQGAVSVAQRRCVRVYFTSGQILQGGVVVDNAQFTPEEAVAENVCVVFRTS
ncbi:hypothetical protein BWQ96_09898 [Gracilariopsis chorda]|uniref:Uncharacterized protein n=1 Tax=Gracilariopsis chorda TaxID=448386 RepID=A0A2V3IEB5_9FLOR|nr:hypothetical protein BWQ96_09898 [Gracilariopsis chorda]|eukprot:PXF40391.1 hypothetical protein BWQ96_09898 [Gracilariopsis chorda]